MPLRQVSRGFFVKNLHETGVVGEGGSLLKSQGVLRSLRWSDLNLSPLGIFTRARLGVCLETSNRNRLQTQDNP